MFWGLRLTARAAAAPPGALAVNGSPALGGDMARLFGAEVVAEAAPVAPPDSRFRLVGVMAAKPNVDGVGTGIALIAIDDKPPRPFTAGARVDDQLVLKTVSARSASLGPVDGPVTVVLEIPPLNAPATGSLPPAALGIEAAQPPPVGIDGQPANAAAPQFAPAPMRPVPGQNGGLGG